MSSDDSDDTFSWIDTIFQYEPSIPLALIFAIAFGIGAVLHVIQSWRSGVRLMYAMAAGCAIEVIGFGLRIAAKNAVQNDPSDTVMFSLQFGLIVLAPIFMAAAVYMLLSYIISIVGDTHAPIPRRTIARIFVTVDVFAFLVQVAGACLITIPTIGSELSLKGLKVMITGLGIQVVGIVVFVALAVRFYVKAYTVPGRWHWLMYALFAGTVLLAIRNTFRMIEYWNGFEDPLAQNETFVYTLDAGLMLILVILFLVVHPGMAKRTSGTSNESEQGADRVALGGEKEEI
ncbi:hypothetical protein M427DRAFT_143062 [Gonapodya prolifera JEL478]|uniref:RTA1-domain-containing protein n=1 Tax=Gonapodya prolifera (strain JEL478) TaxID=1344416 RepID=A0A139AT76_GONPJ|nr:hypothetical protein M427DRAFT_143062 [Gonapodya prolifera JEL478]|eukprot:KXS19705.1 hypothetical protein M427DRAFT_143062 [Gonapodya prolifera JEL478]